MFVDTNSIPFYYLNYEGYTDRHLEMIKLVDSLKINATRIPNNVDNPLRQNRISIGFIKLLEQAMSNNVFPFITMDDDIYPIKDLPTHIEIPEKADLIFWGGSLYETGGYKPNMYIEDYDSHYYRCYYMLSLHCMIVPNLESAKFILDSVNQSLSNNQFLDVDITMKSKDMVFLTPKDGPFLYQRNYNEQVTRFIWEDVKDSYIRKYL